MTQTTTLRKETPMMERRRKRDEALYKEWKKLSANPDQSKTTLIEYLMGKYNMFSPNGVYKAIKRMQEAEEAGKEAQP